MNRKQICAALFAAAALMGLSACGKPEEKQAQGNSPVVEAPVANTMIGPQGAAGISSAIPMTEEAVRAAAPNFSVASVEDQVDGDPFISITLSLGDDEVFRVYPSADRTEVHSVSTRSSRAHSPDGESVGVSLFRDAAPDGVIFCITDFAIIHENGFSCSTDASGAFWRTYRLPDGYDGPSAPFDAIDPDVSAEAMLVEMKWMEPGT
jgi:hypothetical protein